MKRIHRMLVAMCATVLWVGVCAAAPWAMWTDFTGADTAEGLAPQASSTQNNIDGGAWRFKLAGEASVDDGGILSTGTTAAPRIDFGRDLDLGYNGNPFTVVMVVRNIGTATGKPLCCVGSTIGTALDTIDKTAGTATIKGIWENAIWSNNNNVARSVDTLAGAGVTVLATSYTSGGVVVKTVTASEVTTLGTWGGLKSSAFNAQRVFFGNTNNGTSGGLNFELLAVAIYRGAPTDAELTWFADDDAVYTWQGTSGTFHNGPWKTTPRYACAEDGGSSTTWEVFASNKTSYVAPGRILRFAAPEASGDGVFVGALDAQFAPFDLGGLIVEPGATGYSFQSTKSAIRTLDLGDHKTSRATSFVFHEDFTVNRVATGGQSDTTTFHGPVSVVIDEGKTFAIREEAAVASGATVTVTGGGTLALGTTLTMEGSLTVEDGTLSIPNLDLRKVPVTFGENGSLLVSGTLTLDGTTPIRLSALPQTIDLSALTSMPNASYDRLIFFADGVTPDWGNVTLSWGDLGKQPDFVTVTTDETGLSVTVNRTGDNFIVMPMGDSITEGSGNVENAPSYRKALSEQMLAAGMVPRFVGARIYKSSPIADENCRYHTGLSGHRVQTASGRGGYLQGAPNWLEQAGYPDAVTLMIGTNDWINEDQGTEAVIAGAATVFERWKALVKTMVAMRPNTWFIVSPITPPRSDRTNMTTYVDAYNALIKNLFTTAESTLTVNGEPVNCVLGTLNEEGKAVFGENAKVMMASMYDALPAENNAAYFFDNLHPSQAGYDRMAAVWLEAIKTLQGEKGGLKDAEVVVDAYQTAGAMDAVTVVFNHEQKGTEDLSIQVGGVAATISEATLSEDGRRVTLKLSEPLTDGAEVTVGKAGQMRTFTAKATTAESRVGQEATEGYVKVKTLAVPLKGGWHTEEEAKAAFTVTDGAASVRAFDRLGYYVTLARPDGALRYLWVSMDAPGALLTMDALGLPTTSLRVKVSNLRVASNVPGIDNVTEDGVEGLLQFTPNNINTDAADAAHPVSLGDIYDWNTAYGTTAYGYGAMQIFRLYEEGAGRADSGMPASTLFSYSRWASESEGDDEITLGDLANHQGYDTGTQKAASLTSIFTAAFPTLSTAAYSVRTIEIWVRPASTLTWAGATSGTWNKSDASVWKNVATPFVDGDTVAFGELSEGATEATVTVGETVAPLGLIVSKNAFTFAGETISTGALMVAEGASATFSGRLEAGTATVNGILSIAQGSIGAAPSGVGTLVKTGTDALTLDITEASSVLPSYVVQAGKLTLIKGNASDGANFNGTPSFTVASGAHLVLDANDLVGWSHANTVTIAEVAGVLEKLRDINETFSGRLLLKDGAELRNSATDNFFLLHNSAIVEVEAGADASITGSAIRINNGTPEFLAGEGAHLSVSAPLTIPGGITLKKTGEGTVMLSSDVSGAGNGWGTLEVTEGTLNVGDLRFDATLRVGATAVLELAGSLDKGGLPVTIEGTLAGSGVLSGANGNATIAVTSTAKLMAPAKGETLTLSPGNAQSVSIAAGATVIVGEGTLCLANGYAKQGEGSICVALPEGVVLAKGEALPVLTVNAGMGPVVEDFSAPEGLSLYVEDGTLFVANLVAVDRPSGETETWSPAALRALSSAVGALPDGESVTRITSVEVATRGGTAVSTGVAEINAALACFSGIAMAEAGADGTATVRVAYDFGIDAMVVDADRRGVVVTLRVQGPEGEDRADFAEGVQFTFMDAEETPLEATPLEGASLSAGERLFHLSLPQEGEKFAFRVRVSKP